MIWNNRAIDVQLPHTAEYTVIEISDGFRSGTSSGTGNKPVKIESGAMVTAPAFVEVGDVLQVTTADGKYVSRVNTGNYVGKKRSSN